MGIFSSDQKSSGFLGVDIGGSSIKLVELANNRGRAQLITYGYLERSLSSDKAKLIDQPDKTAEWIKKVVEASKATTRRAVTALPGAAVFSSIITLADIDRKDLSSLKKVALAVELEAKKVLPMPVEDMILDWKILPLDKLATPEGVAEEAPSRLKEVPVLLTAAAKEVVEKYISIFKKANLELISLETEAFALARALVGKDPSGVLVVDIGAGNTDISVVENSLPLLNRSVSVGGLEITQGIARTLNITLAQAEQFKRDLEGRKQEWQGEGGMPDVIKRPIQTILDEVEYTINFYLNQPGYKNKRIERVILSGGTANLFNLPKYFSEKLNLRTFLGNPWARVIYPEDLQPVLESVAPRLATALGLALRDIE